MERAKRRKIPRKTSGSEGTEAPTQKIPLLPWKRDATLPRDVFQFPFLAAIVIQRNYRGYRSKKGEFNVWSSVSLIK